MVIGCRSAEVDPRGREDYFGVSRPAEVKRWRHVGDVGVCGIRVLRGEKES